MHSSVNNGQPDWYGRFDVSWGWGLTTSTRRLRNRSVGRLPRWRRDLHQRCRREHHGLSEGVLCGAEQVTIEVTLTNTGENTLTSCMLEYSINGGATQQQSWAGSLEPFETDVVTLPSFTSQGGTNTVEVTVTTPNGVADENALNNTTTVEFTSTKAPPSTTR